MNHDDGRRRHYFRRREYYGECAVYFLISVSLIREDYDKYGPSLLESRIEIDVWLFVVDGCPCLLLFDLPEFNLANEAHVRISPGMMSRKIF
jgi:hypothetical protein